MYSVFLPFGAVVIDLLLVLMYFRHDLWLLGGTTALFALFPLLVTAFLLYSKWTELKLATIFIGFLQSGCQLLLQTTLLIRFWEKFNGSLIQYGTLTSPQYSIILVSCVFSSLVIAKSARECHFLSQDPDRELHVRLSHFRATPFFLLHTSYRAVSLGLVSAFLPVWAWIIILTTLLALNFILASKIFNMTRLHALMTSLTSILTPSLYPTEEATHISVIAKFHILNSACVSAVIMVSAASTNGLTQDNLVWQQPNSTLPTRTPVLLTYGVWPPVLVASLAYVILIILIMGFIRPGFLELPPSQYSSTRNSVKRNQQVKEENDDQNSILQKVEDGLVQNESNNFKMLKDCRETEI